MPAPLSFRLAASRPSLEHIMNMATRSAAGHATGRARGTERVRGEASHPDPARRAHPHASPALSFRNFDAPRRGSEPRSAALLYGEKTAGEPTHLIADQRKRFIFVRNFWQSRIKKREASAWPNLSHQRCFSELTN